MKNVLVLINYNDYETVKTFLDTTKDYKILDSIIVVDNNSTDNSYEKLLSFKNSKIEIIQTKKNGGYGYGNNQGIKKAIKKFGSCNIIVSNPDIIVSEEVIKALIEDLNKSDYAFIGPIINTHGELEKGWKLPTGRKELMLSLPIIGTKNRSKILGYKDCYYDKGLNQVDVISGCFFVGKSDVFKDVGFYDEKVFLYYEENIISSKLKNSGYKIGIDTRYEVIHNHSVSINKNYSSLEKYKILKSSQMYYLKNYARTSLLSIFIIRVITSIVSCFKKK